MIDTLGNPLYCPSSSSVQRTPDSLEFPCLGSDYYYYYYCCCCYYYYYCYFYYYCYYWCCAAATTVATTVACYCCYLLLLSLLLFLATADTRYTAATCYNTFLAPLSGKHISRPRATSGAIDTTVRNSLPSTDRFWHRCYHTTLLLILCLQTLIFQVWLN